MLFATADTHAFHEAMLRSRQSRFNFTDMDEMLDYMVKTWNATVSPQDTVYHLGDFSLKGPRGVEVMVKFLSRLNGKIKLIPGNHDKKKLWDLIVQILPGKIEILPPLYELKVGDDLVVMCHYPLESWNRSHYGSIHLHGHAHGHAKKVPGRMDVGACTSDTLAPYAITEIISNLKMVSCQ